jgi:hypothetical protein
MSENIIVYSCHVGKRDTPVEDGRFYVKGSDKFNSDRMNAKAPKILPHLYLPKHDYSIWVDANLENPYVEYKSFNWNDYFYNII